MKQMRIIFKALSYLILAAMMVSAIGCSKESVPTTSPKKPNRIYPTAASLTCSYVFEEGKDYKDAGLIYTTSKTEIEKNTGSTVTMTTPNPDYTFILSWLTPETVYYYRSCITVNGKKKYGNIYSFTTPAAISITSGTPTVTTNTATIAISTTKPSGYSIVNYGIQYAISTNSIEKGTIWVNSSTSIKVQKLSPNTIYKYRPCVYVEYTDLGGIRNYIYGETKTFKTSALPAPTATVSYSPTGTTATITVTTPDTYENSIEQAGIQYAYTSSAVASASYTQGTFINSTTCVVNITGLKSGTKLYYRPYVKPTDGTAIFGSSSNFTTPTSSLISSIYLTYSGTYAYRWLPYDNFGNNCLRSNNYNIASSVSSSTLTFTLTKQSTLSFYYKVSSESGYDKLTIQLDGSTTVTNGISGTTSSSYSKILSAGSHTISMTYSKDIGGNSNDDRGYIYNIAFDGNYLSNSDFSY